MKGIRIETDVESFAKEYEFDSSVQSIIDQQEGSIKPIFDEYKKEINILLAFVPDGVEEIVRKLKEQEEKYVLLFFIWCKRKDSKRNCQNLRKDSKQKILELMEKITKRTRREFFLLFIRLKSIEIGSEEHQ